MLAVLSVLGYFVKLLRLIIKQYVSDPLYTRNFHMVMERDEGLGKVLIHKLIPPHNSVKWSKHKLLTSYFSVKRLPFRGEKSLIPCLKS